VRTDGNEELRAGVVIDAGGRRSTLPSLLAAIGATGAVEAKQDCGFVYYARHFRSGDGTIPSFAGPMQMPHGSVSVVTLPADNGTWGVAFVTSANDAAMRRLRATDVWTRAMSAYPLAEHWLEGEPLDDGVAVMAKIEDRLLTFVVDGAPVVTGVLALGDSYACTNPSVGRGIAMGALHAVAMRDLLRDAPSEPIELARAWEATTAATIDPWYRDTLAFDEGRLAQMHAEIDGREFEPDPDYAITLELQAAAKHSGEVLRGALDIAGVIAHHRGGVGPPRCARVDCRAGSNWRDERLPGPTRAELLDIVVA